MCGIAGIVGPEAREPSVAAMVRAIRHRGPDGDSLVAEADHAIGHARLAIIDLELGQQPMLSSSGRWLIAFNGEIFNYRELRATAGGYPFRTRSDTEVILALIEQGGLERAFAAIEGMYAIAVFDRKERVLHLARDHFGVKPLYYTHLDGGGVAFASEMKAFVPLGVPMGIDRVAVVTQLLARFIPAPHTGRERISKLRPGEWLSFATDGRAIGPPRRIVPVASAPTSPGADRVATTTALLEAAVKRQTVADVPLGMLLSGGIDSALVAEFAARITPKLHSYCVGYSAADRATEFEAATETAALVNTVHQNIVVERHDFAEALKRSIWHLEEPVATTSLVTYSLLCKAVAAERKVVLSGQGADEPWAGYSRHRFEALLTATGAAARLAAPLGRGLAFASGRARLAEILANLGDETTRWVAYRSLFPVRRIREIFGAPATDEALGRIAAALAWADGQCQGIPDDSFSRLLVRDSYTDLSDNLLLLSDKLSMAHGLEVRVPMLDVAYASHVLRLPRAAKRDGFLMARSKVVHKAVASASLPAAVVNRPKKGFETPLATWLASDFGRELRDSVLSPASPLASLVPAAALFGGVPKLDSVGHELQQQLFSLWVTNEWIDIFR